MQSLSYTKFRNQLAKILDQVNEDHAPVLITRQNGKPVVLVSLEDFQAYEETAYLLRSPANASRLLESIEDLESINGEASNLTKAELKQFRAFLKDLKHKQA